MENKTAHSFIKNFVFWFLWFSIILYTNEYNRKNKKFRYSSHQLYFGFYRLRNKTHL